MPELVISILLIFIFLLAVALITAYICFRRVFRAPRRAPKNADDFDIPVGDIYDAHRDQLHAWIRMSRSLPHTDLSILSHDGLTLRGKYYECQPGAPVELLFHGYQGNAERDLSGGIERCFAMQHNALIIDHRASGNSDGKTITFGILEKRDCLAWIDFAIAHFGADVKLILTGISMGAATVLMTGGEDLPKNVVCILADCSYTTANEIIKKAIREMKLPPHLLYPFVKLGALLFGHFRLEETSPMEAVARCRVPVIFVHGEADDFVPCEMSRRLYETCAAHKSLATIPHAGHGLAYPTDKKAYLDALCAFEDPLTK